MKKKEFLKHINEGIERGAKTKLAKMLKIDPANVTEWFNGRSKPSEHNISKMSALFSMDTQELWDMFNDKFEDPISGRDSNEFAPSVKAIPLTPNNTVTLPILADVPAGLPEFSDRDIEMFVDIPRWLFPGGDFVVKCIGDSLEPEIRKGDYCVIRKMTDPLDCKQMLVKTEHGICMKVVRKGKDGRTWLCSLNPKYKPFVAEHLTIIGLILGRWNRTDRDSFRIEIPEQ